jgi:hypothetical protein
MSSLLRVGSYGGKLAFASNIVANPGTSPGNFVDSGPIMMEARAFTQWLFQPVGTFGKGTAAIVMYVLGTTDPTTSGYEDARGPEAPTAKNWFPIVAQSSETSGDAFTWNNPLQGDNAAALSTLQTLLNDGSFISDSLNAKVHGLVAVRIIATGAGLTGTAVNPNANLRILAIE